ncbi:hypothetical protein B0J12DRAFT_9591 [Macrophomina phaseolina]|uniref:Uncharacterized protein n=1 Tax=Macrophomina phaseolina TaxID=35725 RepID=A0ABQ8GWL8_9PEZI|nr:hypothetical protein B0J12DRAFT_9591 [Macrophomina phaseolina]
MLRQMSCAGNRCQDSRGFKAEDHHSLILRTLCGMKRSLVWDATAGRFSTLSEFRKRTHGAVVLSLAPCVISQLLIRIEHLIQDKVTASCTNFQTQQQPFSETEDEERSLSVVFARVEYEVPKKLFSFHEKREGLHAQSTTARRRAVAMARTRVPLSLLGWEIDMPCSASSGAGSGL